MKCAAPAYDGRRYQGAAGLEIAIAKAKDKIDRPLRRDFRGKRIDFFLFPSLLGRGQGRFTRSENCMKRTTIVYRKSNPPPTPPRLCESPMETWKGGEYEPNASVPFTPFAAPFSAPRICVNLCLVLYRFGIHHADEY